MRISDWSSDVCSSDLLGMLKFDEPFTRLLCQGMVLNHIYSRKNARGAVDYFWPSDVENVTDDKGAIVGARLKTDGSEVQYGGIGTMSKSKNNEIGRAQV